MSTVINETKSQAGETIGTKVDLKAGVGETKPRAGGTSGVLDETKAGGVVTGVTAEIITRSDETMFQIVLLPPDARMVLSVARAAQWPSASDFIAEAAIARARELSDKWARADGGRRSTVKKKTSTTP